MNFSVYVQDDLGKKLDFLAKTEQKSRNTLIREALEFYLNRKTLQQWPQSVLDFSKITPSIPAFESLRDELQPVHNSDLF